MPHKHKKKESVPKIYNLHHHNIARDMIPNEAIQVIHTLSNNGFLSYVVGGSIRDLYLGYLPKDFDIATSARPEQVKQIFKGRCWVVGRRFRLAQVKIKEKIIDVSTFRSNKSESNCLTMNDNRWGSAPEDAMKRDLTINGLFYDPISECITDYVGGINDLNNHILRVIGDPSTRFKQDPVRMIRLIKFKAKFNFQIEKKSLESLLYSTNEIIKSSQARISDEILKALDSGFACKFMQLLYQNDLLFYIMPELHKLFKKDRAEKSLKNLQKIDKIKSHTNSNKKHLISKELIVASIISPFIDYKVSSEKIASKINKILNGSFNIRGRIKQNIIDIIEARNSIMNSNHKQNTKQSKYKREAKQLIDIDS